MKSDFPVNSLEDHRSPLQVCVSELKEELRRLAPSDNKSDALEYVGKFELLAREVGKLVDEKNTAYGNSFVESGKIMQILYPNGISHEQMVEALLVVRILDKLARIATAKDAFGESPFRDISGYGICGLWLSQQEK